MSKSRLDIIELLLNKECKIGLELYQNEISKLIKEVINCKDDFEKYYNKIKKYMEVINNENDK